MNFKHANCQGIRLSKMVKYVNVSIIVLEISLLQSCQFQEQNHKTFFLGTSQLHTLYLRSGLHISIWMHYYCKLFYYYVSTVYSIHNSSYVRTLALQICE